MMLLFPCSPESIDEKADDVSYSGLAILLISSWKIFMDFQNLQHKKEEDLVGQPRSLHGPPIVRELCAGLLDFQIL